MAALFISASAVPMGPYSLGLMGFGGGLFGGHGQMMMATSHIGASFNDGTSFNNQNNGNMMPMQTPNVLNGVMRLFSQADDSLVEGLAVTIKPVDNSINMGNMMGQNNNMGMGYGSPLGLGTGGLLGGFGGAGMYGGLLGSGAFGHGLGGNPFNSQPQQQLEAMIEVVKPANFVPTKALIVFTEPAVSSASALCPMGPVLTEPLTSNTHDGLGGALGGHGGLGFAGAGSMLGGYGSPFGAGPMANSGPDFGVVAEVNLQPGLNTFTIQGLGDFYHIKQLAGHGLSLCTNVQIGVTGKPGCVDAISGCVKLGFTSTPEGVIVPP
ncbi:hypothetical protein ACOMHN_026027 [Nucella lapillus]